MAYEPRVHPARTHSNQNQFLEPRFYARAAAVVLGALAVFGILWNLFNPANTGIPGFVHFDWAQNLMHLGLAGVAAYFGWGRVTAGAVRTLCIVYGVVLAALALFGLLSPGDTIVAGMAIQTGQSLLYLVMGAWGLIAGLVVARVGEGRRHGRRAV